MTSVIIEVMNVTFVTTVSNDWRDRIIDEQLGKCGDAGPDALALARGIMVAGSLIAEAIDAAAEDATCELSQLVLATETIGEKCDELGIAVMKAGERVATMIDYVSPTVGSA
jgi:hypothetical protein